MVKNSTQDYIERSCLRKEKIILNSQSSTDISFFPQNEIMMSALALCLPCLSEKVLCCFSLWRDKLQLDSLYGPGDFIDQEACWSSWCYFSTNLRSDGEKKVRIKASGRGMVATYIRQVGLCKATYRSVLIQAANCQWSEIQTTKLFLSQRCKPLQTILWYVKTKHATPSKLDRKMSGCSRERVLVVAL